LTFREVINALAKNHDALNKETVGTVMEKSPMTCTSQMDLDEARRIMLDQHMRYLPVLDGHTLNGVISFYDVAKAVVEAQGFENTMLKAYIRDWPVGEEAGASTK
jgi:CBS domain-containing protein